MNETIAVAVEAATRRAFASAVDWPGWTRPGRDEASAIAALTSTRDRYERVLAGRGLERPNADAGLAVVERLPGTATTEFGAPGVAGPSDLRTLEPSELDRLVSVLWACWFALDEIADRYRDAVLTTGPRGGGRPLRAILDHVDEADRAYTAALGGSVRLPTVPTGSPSTPIRDALVAAVRDRAGGIAPPPSRRRSSPWSARYGIRRSAWHALDHAWEIEDRATPAP